MPGSSTDSKLPDAGPVAELRDFSYAYPGCSQAILTSVQAGFWPGTCSLISGQTGSGKSTLLLAIQGLLPTGRSQGEVRLACEAGQGRRPVGLVLQNPETQLLSQTVGGEIAFGLENLQIPESRMPSLVLRAMQDVGLDVPLSRPVEQLSMGQKYRLLLAAMLVMEPQLLILDEPSAQLDPDGLEQLQTVIRSLKRQGIAFIIAEHAPAALSGVTDVHLCLQDGRLVPAGSGSSQSLSGSWPTDISPPPPSNPPAVALTDLSFEHTDGKPVWQRAALQLEPGERAALVGPNGSGKSTLLRCICGFVRPSGGNLKVLGHKPVPSRLFGQVGYLFQNPQRQLFETSVAADIDFSLRRLGWDSSRRQARLNFLLQQCFLVDVADRSPLTLSFGQQHLAALAAVIAPEPKLLLLDDPFVGLDRSRKQGMIEIICRMSRSSGTAVLYAGHDSQEPFEWVHSRYGLSEGTLIRYA